MNSEALAGQFEALYGRPPTGCVRAPGRVNLIGEHTDYNDGFVLPIAIDKETLAAYAPRADSLVQMASCQMDETDAADLAQPILPGEVKWANYPRGVAAGLVQRGVSLRGMDLLFAGDVPIGGGLSSSASLEVAAAKAMLAGADAEVAPGELARVCQEAEHRFVNSPCGIMDQAISVMGRAGHALLLDCRSGETRQIPFDSPTLVLLVVDTQVQHEISDGGYAARRKQCEEATHRLCLTSLRDAEMSTIKQAGSDGALEGVLLNRARHVVGEIDRTLEAVAALEQDAYRRFGELLYASHASLRDDYEVSCNELDAVVELARGCEGVYGARMTGGGFGGCAIVLAVRAQAEGVSEKIASGYARRFGQDCTIFATTACDGAGPVG